MPLKPTTFRFDEDFLAMLDGLVQSMSSSRAAVIRQAVGRYAFEYDSKYRGALHFIERLRERYGADKVITLVPCERQPVADDEPLSSPDMEVLIAGQPTDEATGFSVEILKGRNEEGFWVSEEAEVYLHDSKADDARGVINLILGTIPIGPKGERRLGISIRIDELRPEDVDFHTRPYHFHGDRADDTDLEERGPEERLDYLRELAKNPANIERGA